jgi:hypothetical protein
MIIKKTQFHVNLDQMQSDLNKVLEMQYWPEWPLGSDKVANQISLKHRMDKEDWLDGIGSLKDKQGTILAEEKDFTEWNKLLPDYTKTILQVLEHSEGVKFGRIRYMRLLPKSGLRVHYDFERRYHLALQTNRFCMFGHYYEGSEEVAKCYHVPADGNFYIADTRLPHFVYNGSTEERIHLVCSVLEQ